MSAESAAVRGGRKIEQTWKEEHATKWPSSGMLVVGSCDDAGDLVILCSTPEQVYQAVATLMFGSLADAVDHEDEVELVAINATYNGHVQFEDGDLAIFGCANFQFAGSI